MRELPRRHMRAIRTTICTARLAAVPAPGTTGALARDDAKTKRKKGTQSKAQVASQSRPAAGHYKRQESVPSLRRRSSGSPDANCFSFPFLFRTFAVLCFFCFLSASSNCLSRTMAVHRALPFFPLRRYPVASLLFSAFIRASLPPPFLCVVWCEPGRRRVGRAA